MSAETSKYRKGDANREAAWKLFWSWALQGIELTKN